MPTTNPRTGITTFANAARAQAFEDDEEAQAEQPSTATSFVSGGMLPTPAPTMFAPSPMPAAPIQPSIISRTFDGWSAGDALRTDAQWNPATGRYEKLLGRDADSSSETWGSPFATGDVFKADDGLYRIWNGTDWQIASKNDLGHGRYNFQNNVAPRGGEDNPFLPSDIVGNYTGRRIRVDEDTNHRLGLPGHTQWGINPQTGQYEPIFYAYSLGQPTGAFGRNAAPELQRVYWLAGSADRPDAAYRYQQMHSNSGTFLDQALSFAVPIMIGAATGGAGAAAGLGTVASGALAGGATGAVTSGGDPKAILTGAAMGGAGGALFGGESAGAAGNAAATDAAAEFGGLSDAELADILAGGTGDDLAALTGGGMLSGAQAALRDLSIKTGIPMSVLQRASQFGLNYAQSGDARAAALGTGISVGASAAAPYVNRAIDFAFPGDSPVAPSTATSFADAGFDSLKRQGMLPLYPTASQVPGMPFDFAAGSPATLSGDVTGTALPLVAQIDTSTMTDVSSPLMQMLEPRASQVPGALADLAAVAPTTLSGEIIGSAVPSQFDGSVDSLLSASGLLPMPSSNDLNGPGPSEQPKPPTSEEQRDAETAKTIEKLAKIGSALAKLHEGRGTPEDAPRREENQSDADYSLKLADYLGGADPAAYGLDAATIAAHGAPGSSEALSYIMAQADAIIGKLGLDPAFLDGASVEDLASALRSKTREEIDALERALWVRGALGALSTNSKAVNPFTGEAEDINPGETRVQGSRAAYERGRARELQRLGGLQGAEARGMLTGLLDRSPDLFNMQARADARALQEALAAQSFEDPDLKRRRYGFAMSPDYWRDLLDSLTPEQLRALLATFGGDVDRGRAALGQLVGAA